MAKAKKTEKKSENTKAETKVRVINASDATPLRKKTTSKTTNASRKSKETVVKTVKDSAKTRKTNKKQEKAIEEPMVLESKASDKPSLDDKIKTYFKGSVSEIRKVTWPGRKESWNLTISVLVFSGLFAAFTTVIDYGIVQALEKFVLGK
ncbi:preprotein translocase subunit SecE [Candidatus Saccharibacteria bacterium]|jgi:preprotein translocase subunit SecE|nr:preprotein translocase subunit SecE [Candidatus Saccharibacteria bacterium]